MFCNGERVDRDLWMDGISDVPYLDWIMNKDGVEMLDERGRLLGI